MIRIAVVGLFWLLSIATGYCASPPSADSGTPAIQGPTEWTFNFFTPKALYAVVTMVFVIDTNNQVWQFTKPIYTPALDKVIGEWDDVSRAPRGHWNPLTAPPNTIFFCWDSVIDKKVYETGITFSDATIDKMRRPSGYKNYMGETAYYNNIQIGLAPEGKVAIWLRGINAAPNYRVTPAELITSSGEQLVLCKGVTRSDFSYGYDKDTKEFIKGKLYPYGVW